MPDADAGARTRAALVPMLLPDLVAALETVIVAADDAPHIRGYAGGLLSYVYNPLDIIPDDGVVGWLDDAIIASAGLLRLAETPVVELDASIRATCETAVAVLPSLAEPTRCAIEEFIENLWDSTASSPARAAG